MIFSFGSIFANSKSFHIFNLITTIGLILLLIFFLILNRRRLKKGSNKSVFKFADDIDEVGVKAFDYFSTGHHSMGVISFLPIYLALEFVQPNISILNCWWFILNCVFTIGIIWEFIENFILIKYGSKFENRVDSNINAFFDVILAIIGCITVLIIRLLVVDLCLFIFIWVCIIIVNIIIFFIWRKYTRK